MTQVYTIMAFVKDGKGGNAAGAVLEGTYTEERMQEIAAIMGYSETVFVSASETADLRLRYFTPAGEVALCGHATIGFFSLLQHLNRIEKEHMTIETDAGILRIEVKEDGMVMMEQNRPAYLDVLREEEIKGCIADNAPDQRYPIQMVTTGLKDILLPIRSRECLDHLEPDFAKITEVSRVYDAVGIHAFTLDTEEGADAVCRNFAPLYDIDEEAATGTSSCALASYLYRYVCRKDTYCFEQGYSLNSPSRILVRLVTENDEVKEVYVGGYGCVVDVREVA